MSIRIFVKVDRLKKTVSIALYHADAQFVRTIRRGHLIVIEEFVAYRYDIYVAQAATAMRREETRAVGGERVERFEIECMRKPRLLLIILLYRLAPIVKGQIATRVERQKRADPLTIRVPWGSVPGWRNACKASLWRQTSPSH